MLLRVYRLTDKIGLVLLKLGAAFGDWLLDGLLVSGKLVRRGADGIFALLMILVSMVLGLGQQLFNGILWLLRGGLRLLRAIGRGLSGVLGFILRLFGRTARTTARASTSAVSAGVRSANHAVARRAARDEIDVILTEDPLKVQNRRLSALVVILGVFVVGAVLWATDPGRATASAPVAVANVANDIGAGSSLLVADATAQPTGETLDVILPVATAIPTATQIPAALQERGSIAFTRREQGQTDLWAVGVGARDPIRITNDVADERDPSWNTDGTRLAYASQQDGNWELYVYDMATQASSRVTFDLAFQANPRWSPDSLWLVYESYLRDNLEIVAVPLDGSQPPQAITNHPAPDFSPVWSPDGRRIAFVSWRDGNQDIYVISLDNPDELINLTNTPLRNEDHPSWSPDGRFIAFSALEQGSERVFVKAVEQPDVPADVVSFGRTPSWSPAGASIVYAVDSVDGTQTHIQAVPYGQTSDVPTQVLSVPAIAFDPTWSARVLPPQLVSSGGLPLAITNGLFDEQVVEDRDADALIGLQTLPNVQTEQAFLSDRVNDSFNALRERILNESDLDYLRQLDDAFWQLERLPNPGEERRNWHMTGRAFAITRNSLLGFPPPIEVVREDVGVETFWRIYLRVEDDAQTGQLGEPLRQMPWDFLSATQGDVEAYNQGGRLRGDVPSGYYIDLTQLAEDYGWERRAAGSDWRANVATRNFWLFTKTDGLSWYDAMLEIYPEGQLVNFAPSGTGS